MKVRSIGVMALLVTGVVVGCTPGAVAPTAGAPASAAPPSLVPSPAAATPSAAPSIVAPPSVGPSAVATSQAPAATTAPTLAPYTCSNSRRSTTSPSKITTDPVFVRVLLP